MENDFVMWLNDEMQRRGLGVRDVARAGGISHSAVSNVLNGFRNPGPDFCTAIARAFNLPDTEVFRRAGLIQSQPEQTASVAELVFLASQLPEEEVERLVQIARAWAEAREAGREKGRPAVAAT